jgi:hypothetical protein
MTDEWIMKMWYIYTMEFYKAIKKNKIMLFAVKWMKLENFMVKQCKLDSLNLIQKQHSDGCCDRVVLYLEGSGKYMDLHVIKLHRIKYHAYK